MRTLPQVIKGFAVLLFWYGGGYAAFFYVAHFTQVQSLILAAVALCAIDGYRVATKVAGKVQPAFEPIWVKIQPNWYLLCQDFALYDVTKWDGLQAKCEDSPTEYSILRNGFNFTMLGPKLFFSNDLKSFFGELDFTMPLEELKPEKSERLLGPFTPRFYIKQTLAGSKKDIPVSSLV